jgi:SagB-type dehydrogenase family enzyme
MSARLNMSSEVVGSSFASDSELRLPEHPRFLPELVVLPCGPSGLLFEGVRGTQLLNGRGARGFVPRLLEQLDGTRSMDELMGAFAPYPPQAVYEAVAMLFSRGLLEDGMGPPVAPELSEVAAFCGRYVDVTRVNRNRHEALNRLARARTALVGSPVAVQALSSALARQGFDGVRTLRSPSEMDELDPTSDLVLAVFEAGDTGAGAWLDLAWQRGLRVLHANVGAARVEIGPLFIPGKSACRRCLRELRPLQPDEPATDLGLWSGVVALHAFHLLSRIGNPFLYNVCHTHLRMSGGPIYQEVRVARLPGCRTCGLQGCEPGKVSDPKGVVWLLHNVANGMPPRELLQPRDYQMHYAAANMFITKEAPERYHGAVRVALPPGEILAVPPAWDGAPRAPHDLDVPALATLLRHAVGYDDGPDPRRIAPSAGGLGSAELFVIVRQLEGLAPGVYHYFAHEHVLERLRATSDQTLAGALGLTQAELPPVLLVGTATLTKLRQKYNDFSFRFGHLDAGVVRAYLDDMLRALGIVYRDLVDARDKAVAEAISLPTIGTRNMITCTLGIGLPAAGADLRLVVPHQYVDALAELSGHRLPAPMRLAAPSPRPARQATQAPATIPDFLQALLLQRRSTRRFAATAMSLQTAQQIADIASGVDAALTAAGSLPVRMTLWLAIGMDSDDPAAGVYRWHPTERVLGHVRRGVTQDDVHATMLQQALARAPAVLYITGDFEHAVNEHGARGYRELISRAGAIAARALLGAEALGVAACPWGGLCEDGWGRLLGIDRYTDCPLFGVSLGHADD